MARLRLEKEVCHKSNALFNDAYMKWLSGDKYKNIVIDFQGIQLINSEVYHGDNLFVWNISQYLGQFLSIGLSTHCYSEYVLFILFNE